MISLLRSDMNFIKNNHFVLVVHPQVFVKSCIKISSENNEIGVCIPVGTNHRRLNIHSTAGSSV